jgi:hypothetical protein
MALQHLRSSTADKRPTPAAMSDGQLALNTNLVSPGLFFKDSNGDSVKIGPVHVGTTAPNATPGAGGQAGNSKGEQWLDTSSSRYVFKIWDGTAWRTEDGEFVNASGDTMTGALIMDNQQQVRFRETTGNGTNFIAIQAPASVTADRTLTLPDVTGTIVSTADTGTVTSTMILDGTIVNADINASAAIVDTKLATIATAGKVSNSATTATNANTASAIVARDASGNFSAGTITAALTGAASSNVLKAGDTMTGALVVPLASAATPSLTFTGDLNTGIFSPGADQVAVATNGVGRLFVNGNGQVSVVGASTITTNLTVNGGTSFSSAFNWNFPGLLLRRTASNTATAKQISLLLDGDTESDTTLTNYLNIWGTYSGTPTTSSTSTGLSASMNLGAPNAFIAHTNGAERLRITSAGLVGIGTSAPDTLLTVSQSAPTDGILAKLVNLANASGSEAGIRLQHNNTTQLQCDLVTFRSGANAGLDFNIKLSDSAGTPQTRFTILEGGNIGLSEASPTALLHLSGTNTAGGIKIVDSSSSFAAPGIEVIGKRSDGNGSSAFAGKLLLSKNRTDAAINSNNFLGSVAFGGNHTDGTEANILYSASIAGISDGAFNSATDMPTALVFNTGATGRAPDTAGVTTGTERLRITSAGNVGIGTTSPGAALEINAAAATSPFIAKINTSEFARIDSSGRLLVGTSSARTGVFYNGDANAIPRLQIEAAGTGASSSASAAIGIVRNSDVAGAQPYLAFARTRGTTLGSASVVSSGDGIGTISFQGADGTDFVEAASITAQVDGTPGANDMPGRLVFSTTADGASSPTERVRLTNTGALLVGTTTTPTGAGSGAVVAEDRMVISSINAGRHQVIAGDIGTMTATTGTVVFKFTAQATTPRSCYVKLAIANRGNNNTPSNLPAAEYAFQLHRTTAGVCSLNGATTVFEFTYVYATHVAFADLGSGECTVTLTNPTVLTQIGSYKVEVLTAEGIWTLDSVTTT